MRLSVALFLFTISTILAPLAHGQEDRELHIPQGNSPVGRPTDDRPVDQRQHWVPIWRAADALDLNTNEHYYTISYHEDASEQVVTFYGDILPFSSTGELNAVLAQVKHGKNIRLYIIGSDGGDNGTFARFGRTLQNVCRGEAGCVYTTELHGRCASSCVPLFMTGQVRIGGSFSSFGFHATRVMGTRLYFPGVAMHDLESRGVNHAWLQAHRSLFADEQRPTVTSDLAGSNIVTHYTMPDGRLVPTH